MKLKRIVVPILALTMLSSCISFGDFMSSQFGSTSSAPSSFSEIPPPPSIDNSYVHEQNENNFYERKENPYPNTALIDTWNVRALPSVGEQKLLVVPISFTNSPNYGTDAQIKNSINKAFFGESNETGWESVSSYYAKASYGNLVLTGEVSDVFHTNMSTSQLEKKAIPSKYLDQTYYILEDLYTYLNTPFLQQYDQDNDGYVDAIFLVYLAPFDRDSDVFWAFQFYWNRYPVGNKPIFSTYAWASYEFMFEDRSYSATLPAAHTYIHEFGHMMGLDDYYDYDGVNSPLGGLDMMDHNIGDHNMYSKYLLNWSLPFVPTGTSTITLRPAESSGDFILINNDWNGHAYDEYILIEYYTPTGLNFKDANGAGYLGQIKNFTVPGVRIFHIDSRLVYEVGNELTFTNTIMSGGNGTDYATSNTGSDSINSAFKRIHLLDAQKGQQTWFHTYKKPPTNNSLFKMGDKININDWQDYIFTSNKFNKGIEIGYTITIGTMDQNGVTIQLTAA